MVQECATFSDEEQIQVYFMELTTENLDETVIKLSQSKFFLEDCYTHSLILNLQESALRRPGNLELISLLLSQLQSISVITIKIQLFISKFLNFLIQELSQDFSFQLNTYVPSLLYFFLIHDVIPRKALILYIERFFRDKINHTDTIAWILCWFCPEISEDKPELFKSMLQTAMASSQQPRVKLFADQFLFSIEEFSKENWKFVRQKRNIIFGQDPLCQVLARDDIDKLRELSSVNGFNFNQVIAANIYESFWLFQKLPTLLQVAAFMNAERCFRFLLQNNADINGVDKSGRTILLYAIAGGSVEILRDLQQAKFEFNSALAAATSFYQHAIFDWMYRGTREELIGSTDSRGSVINQVWNSNNIREFRVCQQHGVDMMRADEQGNNILHYTALRGYQAMFLYGISIPGIDVNTVGNFNKTPLHYACSNGNVFALRKLLEFPEINCNLQDNEGCTPLHCALRSGLVDCVLPLIGRTDFSIEDRKGFTIIHAAAIQGNPRILAAAIAELRRQCELPDAKASFEKMINKKSRNGFTPLFLSTMYSNAEITQLLVELPEVDPEIREPSHNSLPVYSSILKCNYKAVEAIVRSPKATRRGKYDAWRLAVQRNNVEAKQLIETIEPNIGQMDENQRYLAAAPAA